MRVLDLFSGIGGFSLGLERAGMRTVAFCEIEEYPRQVLAKHWPDVKIYDDVRTLTADALRRDGIAVDLICGGFPCQDISFAGKRAGLEGARSGLWEEYRRIIGEVRPRYVIVENVTGLLSLGLSTVLGDLAALGYDATWDCVPAQAVGAPHRRDRIWIIAYANRQVEHDGAIDAEMGGASKSVADASGERDQSDGVTRKLAGESRSSQAKRHQRKRGRHAARCRGEDLAHSDIRRGQGCAERFAEPDDAVASGWWLTEPDVGRVADGVPARLDRLRGLGNAVLPQIPELIGRAIMAIEAAQ